MINDRGTPPEFLGAQVLILLSQFDLKAWDPLRGGVGEVTLPCCG